MSVDKISALLELMKEYDLVEMEVEEKDFSVALRKQGAFCAQQPMMPAGYAQPMPMMAAPAPMQGQPAAQPAAPAAAAAGDPGLVEIKSPIVGTFYRTPSPEADPFVKEGAKVAKDTVVCIIEAMKIMNEIKAEMDGVIEQVLVESGEPVEYGQPLFLVRKA